MDVENKYFKNISSRERAIFEGAITMGALFHQFIGTPVSIKNADSLEKTIEGTMELQPCIKNVEVHINRDMLNDLISEYDYTSLTGDMLDVRVLAEYKGKKAVIRLEYVKDLKYPLMYVENVD
ncbi:MAG: dihydroneopterin aldolase [Euryarchaeota archaeon]|nr:dihydroneopterin aldolase [Euryarchaeota archaeon]